MKKKILTVFIVAVMTLALVLSLAGCSQYAKLPDQVSVLTELRSNSSDVGILDSVMANYYINKDEAYSDLMVLDIALAEEEYGIAFRKGSAIADKVNTTLAEVAVSGELKAIAEDYGLVNDLLKCEYTSKWDSIQDKSDWDYVQGRGKIIVGYTVFAPIAFSDNSGKLVGFDIELARLVFEKLGLDVEFQVISWDAKEMELAAKTIDCIWNGLTITEERKAEMEISISYLANNQVAVIRKADKDLYTTKESLVKGRMAAEAGSAGAGVIEELLKNK